VPSADEGCFDSDRAQPPPRPPSTHTSESVAVESVNHAPLASDGSDGRTTSIVASATKVAISTLAHLPPGISISGGSGPSLPSGNGGRLGGCEGAGRRSPLMT
jgi:hypothetical protein